MHRILEIVGNAYRNVIDNAIFKMKDIVGMPEIEPDMLIFDNNPNPFLEDENLYMHSSGKIPHFMLWQNEYGEQYDEYAEKYGRLDVE